jgi:hypothetical protein
MHGIVSAVIEKDGAEVPAIRDPFVLLSGLLALSNLPGWRFC